MERTNEYQADTEQLLQQAQKPFVVLADCLNALSIHDFGISPYPYFVHALCTVEWHIFHNTAFRTVVLFPKES
ncbi:MAG: hypothetical protein GY696_32375 [Gammaproteobacteria bacterium]|nr:hypothetical protein [Gammaproteobacteria bacterium]